MTDGARPAWSASDVEVFAGPRYYCHCHSICKSSCECADCLKLFRGWTDVEEALKEVFEGKKMVETLLQCRSNLKVEGVLCDHYLSSSWG